jgi:hypothetical protein
LQRSKVVEQAERLFVRERAGPERGHSLSRRSQLTEEILKREVDPGERRAEVSRSGDTVTAYAAGGAIQVGAPGSYVLRLDNGYGEASGAGAEGEADGEAEHGRLPRSHSP